MDRVSRRFLVLSTTIVIPALLLMASLTSGASPDEGLSETRLAVEIQSETGDGVAEGEVRQVVGKQLETGKTRPGLFQAIAGGGSSKTTHAVHNHNQSTQSSEPRGLFDSLFSSGSNSNQKTTTRTTRSQTSTRTPAATSGGEVNWDGIPYHPTTTRNVNTASTPIRDPNQLAPNTNTRIIRGGTTATPVATRSTTSRAVAARPSAPLAVPMPPREETQIQSTSRSLSSSTSSRRSDRDSSADNEPITPAPTTIVKTSKPVLPSDDEVVDLIPRVSRRQLPATDAAKSAASKTVATTTTQSEELNVAPAPKSATVAPKVETVAKTPASAVTADQAPAAATLAAPKVTSTYTTPVDPTTTAIPMPSRTAVPETQVPNQPYAASTPMANIPAATISHRAGPPAAAFVPNQDFNSGSTLYGQSTGTAIGSGVAAQDNFGAASQLTRPYVNPPAANPNYDNGNFGNYPPAAPAPAMQTAQANRDPFDDPYGRRDNIVPPRPMSTFGQPNSTPATTVATDRTFAPSRRPAHETASVPMLPIDGYQKEANPSELSNFDRNRADQSTPETRNQMRSAAPREMNQGRSGMVSSELPGIRVVTRGPDSVMIRQTNEYEILVENRGSIDAEGLIVRAMIPDWAEVRGQNATRGNVESQAGDNNNERLVWTIDQLPAGTSETMYVRLMAARSGTHDVDVDWTLMPQKSVAHVKVHEPQLDLTIEGPDEVVYGQSQAYKVRVLNPGDGVAPNVTFTLSPDSPTPQTQRIGDIPAGKEAQFDVELTAQDLGDLKIHGLAIGDFELRAEANKTIRVSAAQIEAVLNGPELKYQNTEAMYNLQVQNNGTATSERVVATLRIPSGVKYLGGVDGADIRANTLRWEIKSLAPGATRDYQFRCQMTGTGEHLFAFDCKGSAAGQADVSLMTRVDSISDLVLTINDPIAPAPIGSEVTYEIIVRNRGSREARDVKTLAQFSHGIEPQRVDGQSGEVVTGQVLFDAIPRIGAGEEVRMRVIAIADRAGHHRFRTEVRSGDTVLVAEEATHYMSPQADRVSRRSSDKQVR